MEQRLTASFRFRTTEADLACSEEIRNLVSIDEAKCEAVRYPATLLPKVGGRIFDSVVTVEVADGDGLTLSISRCLAIMRRLSATKMSQARRCLPVSALKKLLTPPRVHRP